MFDIIQQISKSRRSSYLKDHFLSNLALKYCQLKRGSIKTLVVDEAAIIDTCQ